MNFREELRHIEQLLDIKEYTVAAKECVGLVEQILQQVLKQYWSDLEEEDRLKVQQAEWKRGKGKRGIERFTMGELINVIIDSNFFDALIRATGKDLSRVWLINFDELRKLRNKFAHDFRKASRAEAEFLFRDLKVMLEDFGIVSVEEVGVTTPPEKERERLLLPRLEGPGVQLSQANFQRLTQILQKLPEFTENSAELFCFSSYAPDLANKGHHVLKKVIFQFMREDEVCDTSIHKQFL